MLLPAEHLLSAAAGVAAFFLAVSVWLERRLSASAAVLAGMAVCASLWASADWMGFLRDGADPSRVRLWQAAFYASVAVAPALVVQAARWASRRPLGVAALWYAGGILAAVPMVAESWGVASWGMFGAVVGIALFASAAVCAFAWMFHALFSASEIERRRAWGAAAVIVLFLASGTLQLVRIDGVPSWATPVLVLVFAFASAAAAVRTGLLEAQVSALEAAFLPLATAAVVALLRARGPEDAALVLAAMVAMSLYGAAALRIWRKERLHAESLDIANRELSRIEEMRKDVVDMVAHQLRSPLGGIRAAADTLAEGGYGPVGPACTDAAHQIRRASERLLRVVETFLAAARLEAGTYRGEPVEANVRGLLEGLVDEARTWAGPRPVAIALDLDGVPERASIDVAALENVVFNFLDNALKYTDRGNIFVAARWDDGWLEVAVKDGGRGFAPEERRGLFQKFRRGSAGRAVDRSGAGVGLYAARLLAEAAGGSVDGQSAGVGQGATFRLRLPAAA